MFIFENIWVNFMNKYNKKLFLWLKVKKKVDIFFIDFKVLGCFFIKFINNIWWVWFFGCLELKYIFEKIYEYGIYF